jgi:hypothetical protein
MSSKIAMYDMAKQQLVHEELASPQLETPFVEDAALERR